MSDLSNGSEITMSVEEAMNGKKPMKKEDDEREVYRISYEANGIRFSQIEKPKPLICSVCKGPFVNPIVTKCNHFFCETCAQKKSDKCFVCAEPTSVIFEHKMRLFIRNPVEPQRKAQEREIAKAKKKEVLETLNETLEYTNGWKRKMSNGEKAVKIVEEVETLLKKAIQKATKSRETEMGAFIMMKEAMATMMMFQVKLDKAFEVMVNMNRRNV